MGLNKKQLQTIFENMKIYSEKTDKITTINKLQETGFYHFLKTSKPQFKSICFFESNKSRLKPKKLSHDQNFDSQAHIKQ